MTIVGTVRDGSGEDDAISTQHTPEPWAVFNGPAVERSETWSESYFGTIVRHDSHGGKRIADTSIGLSQDYAEGKANARRIVACVNACAGMSNDLLENIAITGGMLSRFAGLNETEQQRDDFSTLNAYLVAACCTAISLCELGNEIGAANILRAALEKSKAAQS